MLLTTVFLSGWLAIQDPVKPQDATKSTDSKASGQVDAELKTAIEELKRAQNYRFEVDGTATCPKKSVADASGKVDPKKGDDQGADAVAHAKSGKTETIRVSGVFQQSKPSQIKSDKIEAYRSSDKLVWRTKDQKDWMVVPAHVGEPPSDMDDADGSGKADEGGAKDDGRTAKMLASLPLPDDLIRMLDSRIVSCQKGSGSPSGTTYECVVASMGGDAKGGDSKERADGARGDAQGADAKRDGKNCSVRFTVNQGKIVEINLKHPAGSTAKPGGAPSPSTSPSNEGSIDCRYKISDVGSATEVKVPEDAARLLGSR